MDCISKINTDKDRRVKRAEVLGYANPKNLANPIMKNKNKRKLEFRFGKWYLKIEDIGGYETIIIIATLITKVIIILYSK